MSQRACQSIPIRNWQGTEGVDGSLPASLPSTGERDELYCPEYWKPKPIQNHETSRQNILHEQPFETTATLDGQWSTWRMGELFRDNPRVSTRPKF